MKKIYLLPLLFLIPVSFLIAQNNLTKTGGGEYVFERGNCLSEPERSGIKQMLAKNIKDLKKEGILPTSSQKDNLIVAFNWPLQKAAGLDYFSYYGISNFVDHNSSSNILDYNCTQRTYNGHKGTDIFTWPFPWYLVDNDYVEVIAAAAGTIINKFDNQDDDHCSFSGSWNAVYIQHDDGSVAWYGHLKKNSLTNKGIGQTVNQGEYLGVVASSGWSTGPHLHFEIYDEGGSLIDPYSGDCNNLNSSTWWSSQQSYREPKVNAVFTHDAEPEHGCPGANENPHFSNNFSPGETIYLATYYQDQLNGNVSSYKIRRPNNSIWDSWTHTSPNTYNSSWWYWTRVLPTSGPFGTWKYEVVYQGVTYTHDFVYSTGGPVNDFCADAIEVVCGTTINGSTSDATLEASLQNCGTALNTAPGVWYRYVGTGETITVSLCDSGYDTKLGVFSGNCNNLVCTDGDDDDGCAGTQSEVEFISAADLPYYFYVTGYNANAGNFTLTVDCGTPPSCNPPLGLEQVNLGYSHFTYNWDDEAGVTTNVRYRAVGATNWITLTNFSALTSLNKIPCTQYELQVQSVCDGVPGFWSASEVFTTDGCSDPYCYSYGNSYSNWIEGVSFENVNNNTGNGFGYINYTNMVANVDKGESYTITLDPDNDDGSSTVYWRVWIDFNGDNDFNDSGEQVVSTTSGFQSSITASISIPLTAITGETRMRVSMGTEAYPTPCETGNDLDVEDYGINLAAPVCVIPAGLTADEIGYSYMKIDWQPVTGATLYQTRARAQGGSWIMGGWFIGQTIHWAGMSPCTTYEFQIRADCDGINSDFSTSIFESTTGCGDDYCYSYGLTWNDWIAGVNIANINNNTGNGYGYTNYTNLTANVEMGQDYTITLAPGTDIGTTTVYWRIWIDYNGDGDFTDPIETVLSITGNNQTSTSATITIPPNLQELQTRMRVSMSTGGYSDPCQTSGNRDVEDYSISLIAPEPELEVSPSTVNFNVSGGTQPIVVTSNIVWSASENVSWLSLSGNSGNGNGNFSIVCNENFSINSRSTTVTVTGGGLTRTITVNQAGASTILDVSPQVLNYAETGGSQSITVTSNIIWSASENVSWLSLTGNNGTGNGSFTVICNTNTSINSRTATITVTGGGITRTITVTQLGEESSLLVSPFIINFPANADVATVSVTSNISWIAGESVTWLSLSGGAGSNNGSFTINCTENTNVNSRSTTVVVSGAGITQTITVTQEGTEVTTSVTPTVINTSAAAGCVDIMITTNSTDAWEVYTFTVWITSITPLSGLGNGTVTICFDENTGVSPRTGTVFVEIGANTIPVTLTQEGQAISNDISFSPENIILDWEGTPVSGNLMTSNGAIWTASPSESWLNVNPVNGTGSQSLDISANSNNTSGSSRIATVLLQSGTVSFTVFVTQLSEESSLPPWGEPTATISSGTLIGQVQIDGISASAGDWLAAFDEDGNLAGSKEVIINQGIAYTNLVIYGDDAGTSADEGISGGETFILKLFDVSTGLVLDYPNASNIYQFTEWVNTNGAPMPAYNDPEDIYNFASSAADVIVLTAGWNLISTDVVPQDSAVVEIMSNLRIGNLEYVTGFDGAANFYDPSLPSIFNTLTHWERGFGYWIRVTEADTLLVSGSRIDSSYFKPMDNAWNLVAYLPQAPQAPEDYFSDFIASEELLYATGFDGAFTFYDPYGLAFLNDLVELRNSKGYWIKLQNIDALETPNESSKAAFLTTPNPIYEFIWGQTNAPQGVILEIVDESNTLWAEVRVGEDGLLKPFTIYGDNILTSEIEGPTIGEVLFARWQGETAMEEINFQGSLRLKKLQLTFANLTKEVMRVFPMPFSESLQLELQLPSNIPAEVIVTDIFGRVVWTYTTEKLSSKNQIIKWQGDGEKEGLYIITLYQDNKQIARSKAMLIR